LHVEEDASWAATPEANKVCSLAVGELPLRLVEGDDLRAAIRGLYVCTSVLKTKICVAGTEVEVSQ
jgi:hypothetical protein